MERVSTVRAVPWRICVEAYRFDGTPKARWEGVPLVRRGPVRVLAARWRRPPVEVGPLRFEPGDTLVEWLSAEAWFNAFRVSAPDGRLRGWYVNLVRPSPPLGSDDDERWSYVDLGLDFAVTPQDVVVLDEDDAERALARLAAPEAARAQAEAGRLRRLLSAPGPALAFLEGLLTEGLAPGEEHAVPMACRWGPPAAACFARVRLGDEEPGGGRGWLGMALRGARVAEAIAVLVRGDRVLLHRKATYPEGAMRLPGGGVAAGEAPDVAVLRELQEETGLLAQVVRWLAYVRWEIVLPDGARFVMPNYAFLLADDGRRAPVPSAEERIVELAWRPLGELAALAASLRELPGGWGAWGTYRAVPHELVAGALQGDAPGDELPGAHRDPGLPPRGAATGEGSRPGHPAGGQPPLGSAAGAAGGGGGEGA